MSAPTIAVVTAGLSEPSSTALLADRLLEAVQARLRPTGAEARAVRIDLRGLAHGIADHLTMGFPSGKLAAALDALRGADAVIAVTPTFKASYTGLFKSFWDLVEDGELDGVPTLLAATGGTARHSLMIDVAMRPLFAYLRADAVPTGVFAATDDFGADESLQRRIDRAAGELAERIRRRTGEPAHDVAPAAAPAGPAEPGAVETRSAAGEELSPAPRPLRSEETAPGDPALTAPSGDESSPDPARAASGTASHRTAHRASGLPPLRVTPFEQLLRQ
ncbi:CE1759 family FMN reductase [Rothia halotolerans]|uniref:CE1759 family FMN reductase n=1 Tax=Rothia halotolerans TaxID=405770 RepID=UPI00101D74AC|nr:CE1759 family FMN reductase [Rothia halotolerans]